MTEGNDQPDRTTPRIEDPGAALEIMVGAALREMRDSLDIRGQPFYLLQASTWRERLEQLQGTLRWTPDQMEHAIEVADIFLPATTSTDEQLAFLTHCYELIISHYQFEPPPEPKIADPEVREMLAAGIPLRWVRREIEAGKTEKYATFEDYWRRAWGFTGKPFEWALRAIEVADREAPEQEG